MSVREELVRSRGFIRGAETQLAKALDALDAETAEAPTEPLPEPEPTEEPTAPPPTPERAPSHAQDWSAYPVGHEFTTGWGAPPIEVVAPFDGLTAPRALRVGFTGTGGHSGMPESGWYVPRENESIYFRLMFYNDLPEGSRGFDHGLQSNIDGGQILHFWQLSAGSGESPSSDHFSLGFGSRGSGDEVILYNPALPKRTWLRLEWAIHRGQGTAGTVEVRITDTATGQAWDETTFRNQYGVGPRTLPEYPLTIAQPVLLGSYHFGVSGSGLSGSPVYYAAFAVGRDGWLGAA